MGYNKDFTVAPKMNQDGRALGIAQKIKDVKKIESQGNTVM